MNPNHRVRQRPDCQLACKLTKPGRCARLPDMVANPIPHQRPYGRDELLADAIIHGGGIIAALAGGAYVLAHAQHTGGGKVETVGGDLRVTVGTPGANNTVTERVFGSTSRTVTGDTADTLVGSRTHTTGGSVTDTVTGTRALNSVGATTVAASTIGFTRK